MRGIEGSRGARDANSPAGGEGRDARTNLRLQSVKYEFVASKLNPVSPKGRARCRSLGPPGRDTLQAPRGPRSHW